MPFIPKSVKYLSKSEAKETYATKDDLENELGNKANKSELFKGIHVNGGTGIINVGSRITPGYLFFNTPGEGIKITKGNNGPDDAVNISLDTDYIATKEDLDSKANDSSVFKKFIFDDGFNSRKVFEASSKISPNTMGVYFGNSSNPHFKITQPSPENLLSVQINTDVIATKESVDSLKSDFDSLLNDENLNDSFDTLKEVDTWIKNHESEAADIISDINSINTTLTNIDEYITPTIGVTYNAEHIDLSFHAKNLEGEDRGFIKSIPTATQTHSGVISKTDKIKLDSLNIKSDEVEETYTIDEQSKSVKLSEYDGGKVVYPITLSKNVYNEDGSTLEHTIANLPNIYGEEVVELPEVNNEKISRDELSKDLFIKLWIARGDFTHIKVSDYDKENDDFILNELRFKFDEAIDVYEASLPKYMSGLSNNSGFEVAPYYNHTGLIVRTVFPTRGYGNCYYKFTYTYCSKLQTINMIDGYGFNHDGINLVSGWFDGTFYSCNDLERILTVIQPRKDITENTFHMCYKLKDVKILLNFVATPKIENIDLSGAPQLSYESIKYLVDNKTIENVVTVKLNPYIYAKVYNGDCLFNEDDYVSTALNNVGIYGLIANNAPVVKWNRTDNVKDFTKEDIGNVVWMKLRPNDSSYYAWAIATISAVEDDYVETTNLYCSRDIPFVKPDNQEEWDAIKELALTKNIMFTV